MKNYVFRIGFYNERDAYSEQFDSQIAESNGRAIQAMLDNAATDRLRDEERTQQHEERVRLHEEEMKQLKRGLLNLAVSIDADRPTILRLLNSNNNKLDLLLIRLPPQQQ